MSPMLDATKIQNEDELTQEQEEQKETADETPPAIAFDPIRSITLPLPADCGTSVTLLVQLGGDNFYRKSGFRILRSYQTSPHEQGEYRPPTDTAVDEFKILGEAVVAAAEMADEWLQFNSDDKDEKAQAASAWLVDWIAVVDPVAINDGIFDLAEDQVEVLSGVEPTATPAVTDEAQRHYDERKHSLEERLGTLSIEQVRLKAAVKCNREAMNTVTGELEDHLARGVVRLPLFDRLTAADGFAFSRPTKPAEAVAEDTDKAKPAVPADEAAVDESAEPAEAWRVATIEEIGIDPKICQLLRDNNNIETLGQIADHCNDYELTDLKKIGKAKAEKIEQAMDAYWQAHPLAEVADAEEKNNKELAS